MKTEIIIIADRSGSMQIVREDAQGAINAFLADQREVPGEARVTLVQFDDKYEVVYQGRDVQVAPSYELQPRGCTALLDAVGKTLAAEGLRIAGQKWADLVIVMVVTDGLENASAEYTQARVKEMVTHCEKHGWSFIWQAANIDAFSVAKNLGSMGTMNNSYAATAAGMRSMSTYASTAVLSKRMGLSDEDAAQVAYLAVEKEAATLPPTAVTTDTDTHR